MVFLSGNPLNLATDIFHDDENQGDVQTVSFSWNTLYRSCVFFSQWYLNRVIENFLVHFILF